jgi:hypothetical protein
MDAMRERGAMLASGPFDDRPDESLRGLCLYRTSVEEARELAAQDPAVQAGRLVADVMTWLVPSGLLRFPAAVEPT